MTSKKKTLFSHCFSFIMAPIFWLVFLNGACAYELEVLTHSLQGQVYKNDDGDLFGKKHAGKRVFNLEVVKLMMQSLDYKNHAKIKEMPFKRAFKLVQVGESYALFNVSRTPDREEKFKWVGPLQTEVDYFYEMKKNPTGIRTLEDAKKVELICVLNGGVHQETLKNNGFENLFPSTSYETCFKMLATYRVALTPSAESTLDKKSKVAGLDPDSVHQTPVIVLKSQGFIAISTSVPDWVVDKWQSTLDSMKSSGEYQRLYTEYFLSKAE